MLSNTEPGRYGVDFGSLHYGKGCQRDHSNDPLWWRHKKGTLDEIGVV